MEAEYKLIVYPTSRQVKPYNLTTRERDVLPTVKAVLRTDDDDPAFVEVLPLFETSCAKELGNPWEYPQWKNGAPEESSEAYGRKDLKNWVDAHSVMVHEHGSFNGMSMNEYFQGCPTRSGHRLRGPVIVQRFLHEQGCGDSVTMPVDATVLAKYGLPDPRSA